MATKEISTKELVADLVSEIRGINASGAVNLEEHQADTARRAAERAKTAELREQCLDPEFATQTEMEKTRHEYTVRAVWREMGKKKLETVQKELKVVGLNENDAWARFCDSVGCWPGRRGCKELEIVKGKQVSVSEFAASQSNRPYSANGG